MGVGRDVGYPVAWPHAQPLEGRGPTIAAAEKLLVGQAQVAVHDRLTLRVEAARAPEKLEGCQRCLHRQILKPGS